MLQKIWIVRKEHTSTSASDITRTISPCSIQSESFQNISIHCSTSQVIYTVLQHAWIYVFTVAATVKLAHCQQRLICNYLSIVPAALICCITCVRPLYLVDINTIKVLVLTSSSQNVCPFSKASVGVTNSFSVLAFYKSINPGSDTGTVSKQYFQHLKHIPSLRITTNIPNSPKISTQLRTAIALYATCDACRRRQELNCKQP